MTQPMLPYRLTAYRLPMGLRSGLPAMRVVLTWATEMNEITLGGWGGVPMPEIFTHNKITPHFQSTYVPTPFQILHTQNRYTGWAKHAGKIFAKNYATAIDFYF